MPLVPALRRASVVRVPALALGLLVGAALPARAGTVRIETEVPIEVTMKGMPVAKSYAAGTVTLDEVEPGEHELQVWREGKPAPVLVPVPEEGVVRLLVGADSLSVADAAGAALADAPAPRLSIQAPEAGQRFFLLIDGAPAGAVLAGSPLELATLGPGPHAVEVRSEDRLTVWARGVVELQPGDALVMKLHHGRMPEVFGRAGAWRDGR